MTRGPDPKISRLMKKYGLDELGNEIERRWTDPEDGDSLRELARDINIRVLRSAFTDGDETTVQWTVEEMYKRLTDDDVSQGTRTEVRSQLRNRGIDIDRLLSDFVSRQAVHNYLRTHRGVELPDSSSQPENVRADRLQSVQRLRGRLETVIRSVLDELTSAGHLTLGDATIHVTARVRCSECGTQQTIDTLLKRGSCDCESENG
jgi:hypothetical protein